MIKMKKTKPTIGISLRIIAASNYDEKRDALSQDSTKFFEKLKINPLLIPNRINHIPTFLDEAGLLVPLKIFLKLVSKWP